MPKTQNKASSATVYRPTTSKASKQKRSSSVHSTELHTPHTPDPLILQEDGTVYSTSTTAQKFIPELILSNPQKNLWLYRGDSLALLDAIAHKYPHGHFDCIFADPPYFLSNGGITCYAGKMVKVDKGDWDKSSGPDQNHQFNREWLGLCQRVLKPNATIWVSGTHHVIFSIGFAMQQLGFKILNTITWEKPNPPPNLSCRYFTHSTEIILWAAKNEKSKHVFNYEEMRKVTGKQMKTVWRADEFKATGKELSEDIWTIAAPSTEEKKFGKHPTQKPIALIERCLLASTHEGDLVLDPFLGGGTTAVAALRLNRGCVGIEAQPEYAQLAAKRCQDAIDHCEEMLFL